MRKLLLFCLLSTGCFMGPDPAAVEQDRVESALLRLEPTKKKIQKAREELTRLEESNQKLEDRIKELKKTRKNTP